MSASIVFDKLRAEFGLSSDSALAHWMGVGKSDISKTRKSGVFSDGMILRTHEKSNWPVAQIRKDLGQPAPHQ